MIDIQVDSFGVELVIDIEQAVDDFDSVELEIISPTGNIITIQAVKEQDTTIRAKLKDNITEIGIWSIQAVGITSGIKSYSELGEMRANKNLKELF